MDLFANELSIDQQFRDLSTFRRAIDGLLAMRGVARRFDRTVNCCRNLVNVEPIPGMPMQQAVKYLALNQRRAWMNWLTKHEPFWDDFRHHHAADWLECRDDIITDSTVGEAAYRSLNGIETGLVSAAPSDWNFPLVEVLWRRELDDQCVTLENWWDDVALEGRLQEAPPPIRLWTDLKDFAARRFQNLTFADRCFEPLEGVPFAKSAEERIRMLLKILDQFSRAFDASGARTPEGNEIYRKFFTRENSLFSDSSEKEKRDFRKELSFRHSEYPEKPDLFCTWHGKVSHQTLRLHFSWPIRAGEPVYIVYIGPKLTRR